MQAKIDPAPKPPHHPKPALAVFTLLAIRSSLVIRRRNSSPCPNLPEDDDYSVYEDDGIDFSHAHDLCKYEPTLKLTGAKCPLFNRFLGFPDNANTEKMLDWRDKEESLKHLVDAAARVSEEIIVISQEMEVDAPPPDVILTQPSPIDPIFENMLRSTSQHLSERHQQEIQVTGSRRIIIDGIDSQDPAIQQQ